MKTGLKLNLRQIVLVVLAIVFFAGTFALVRSHETSDASRNIVLCRRSCRRALSQNSEAGSPDKSCRVSPHRSIGIPVPKNASIAIKTTTTVGKSPHTTR